MCPPLALVDIFVFVCVVRTVYLYLKLSWFFNCFSPFSVPRKGKKLAQSKRSYLILQISWKHNSGWLLLVVHFSTDNCEEYPKKHPLFFLHLCISFLGRRIYISVCTCVSLCVGNSKIWTFVCTFVSLIYLLQCLSLRLSYLFVIVPVLVSYLFVCSCACTCVSPFVWSCVCICVSLPLLLCLYSVLASVTKLVKMSVVAPSSLSS